MRGIRGCLGSFFIRFDGINGFRAYWRPGLRVKGLRYVSCTSILFFIRPPLHTVIFGQGHCTTYRTMTLSSAVARTASSEE